jgi:hypothetical protein
MLVTERRWRSGFTLVAMTVGLHTACGDDEGSAPSQSTGGNGGSQTGGSDSKAGQGGGTPALGGSAGGGARAAGGREAMAGAGAPSEAGATEGAAAHSGGGAPQAEGGAGQGGSQPSEGGTAPAAGGANEAGLGGAGNAGGAGGAGGEPCAGEIVADECVLPHPVRRVQSAKRTAGTGAASDVVKLPAATTSGNFLVLGVGIVWSGTAQAVAAPAGFTLVEQRDNTTGTSQHESAAFYIAENAPALPAATGVTVSTGIADTRIFLALAEYAGLSMSSALDQQASQVGSGSLSSGATAQTSADDELWLALTLSRGGGGHSNPTNGFATVEMLTTGAGSFSFTEYFARQRGVASSSLTGGGDFAAVIATFR